MPACALTISPNAQKPTPSPYGRHRPCRHRIRSGSSSMNVENSRSRRVLPTPGSPITLTSWGEPTRASWSRYSSIFRKTCRSVADSSALPTNVVRCCSRRSMPIRLRARNGRQIASASALPFTVTGGSSSNSKTADVAWWAVSPTTIVPVGATFCSRDAVFTTSPVTLSPICGPWPNAITASPVLIPMRTASSKPGCSRFASSTSSRICRPARIARSGSSSWPTGAPNTPSTASPMNLSTVPPK